MKIADFLMPLLMSLLTVWAINYFFLSDKSAGPSIKPGQEFVAPTSMQATKPLNLEIDFVDKDLQSKREATKTVVNTPYAQFEFNNNGAILEKLDFKRIISGKEQLLSTIAASTTEIDRERQAFLVAFNNNTPYLYNLSDKTENPEFTKLTYKANSDLATVLKTFIIYNDKCQIDLDLEIIPTRDSKIQARVILPTPYMQDVSYKAMEYKTLRFRSGYLNGLVFSEKDTLKKTAFSGLYNKFWANPGFFGAEDKFFVHTLFKDSQNFVERGYYKFIDQDKALIIYEGPESNQKTKWSLSFYLGPKESDIMAKVDTKLEQALDYGWFAPISKPLLSLLKWFYKYLRNYGFAIIALTLLIKLLLVPFTISESKTRERQKEMRKKMQYIEQKYKDDKERLALEKAELIKKQGIPDMLGCLPMLIQIPIFIGLNRVLTNSIELYHAPFIWWIKDLSAPDYFLMPVLIFIAMFYMALDINIDSRQRIMQMLMAVVVAAMMTYLSAGLALFIAVSSWAGIAQTKIQKAFKA
ncbi:membrane protein insertase YidC [Candidatus Dependentiae bacterium]|nr:membrane protein insertase YidC [Candidatus Dependentiae bacterium]